MILGTDKMQQSWLLMVNKTPLFLFFVFSFLWMAPPMCSLID
jgi:hypothetical protein